MVMGDNAVDDVLPAGASSLAGTMPAVSMMAATIALNVCQQRMFCRQEVLTV
jgi:hypothetical protein